MSQPTISVILPNRNHGDYLGRAIGCLCGQDYQPCEVLVIDDASTDDSRDVIEAYQKAYPFFWWNFRYEKLSDHLQYVCDTIPDLKGDYVYFASANDMVFPGFFRAAADAIADNPRVGVVFSDIRVIKPDGKLGAFYHSGAAGKTLRGEAMQAQLCRGWEAFDANGNSIPVTLDKPAQFRILKPDVFETGCGALVRRDALLWLNSLRAWELGPWYDGIGFPAVAMKYGASYLSGVYGGMTAETDGPQFSKAIYDPITAVPLMERVQAFLAELEVAEVMPSTVADAMLQKVACRIRWQPNDELADNLKAGA